MLTSQLAVGSMALKAYVGARLRRLGLIAILVALAFVFAIPALGFIGLAGFHALASSMVATHAALVVAGVMSLFVLILALAAALISRRAGGGIGAALVEPASVIAPLREGIRTNPGTWATSAAVLGFIVGSILRRR